MSDCRKCAKFEECAVDEDCGLFKPKPQTNADRIRTMTDDELVSVLLDERCSFCDANNYSVCNSTKRCHEEIEAWLRAEVKDG